jgi:hypothetical protein
LRLFYYPGQAVSVSKRTGKTESLTDPLSEKIVALYHQKPPEVVTKPLAMQLAGGLS